MDNPETLATLSTQEKTKQMSNTDPHQKPGLNTSTLAKGTLYLFRLVLVLGHYINYVVIESSHSTVP